MFTDALLQEVFNTDKESEVPRDLAKLRNQLRSCIESASGGTRGEGETIAKEKEKLAPVAGALLALAEGTADLGEAKRKISTWYDAAMERLSGVYKRWTQAALFVIGLIMAGGLGVDPLSIASALWENPALRASTVELAEAFVETEAPDSSDSSDDVEQPSKLMEQRMSEARAYAAQLQQSRLPLHPFKDRNNTSDWLRSHWLGFLLSALATAMGAPFWFDLLGRVISLRTSVKSTSRSNVSPRCGHDQVGIPSREDEDSELWKKTKGAGVTVALLDSECRRSQALPKPRVSCSARTENSAR